MIFQNHTAVALGFLFAFAGKGLPIWHAYCFTAMPVVFFFRLGSPWGLTSEIGFFGKSSHLPLLISVAFPDPLALPFYPNPCCCRPLGADGGEQPGRGRRGAAGAGDEEDPQPKRKRGLYKIIRKDLLDLTPGPHIAPLIDRHHAGQKDEDESLSFGSFACVLYTVRGKILLAGAGMKERGRVIPRARHRSGAPREQQRDILP